MDALGTMELRPDVVERVRRRVPPAQSFRCFPCCCCAMRLELGMQVLSGIIVIVSVLQVAEGAVTIQRRYAFSHASDDIADSLGMPSLHHPPEYYVYRGVLMVVSGVMGVPIGVLLMVAVGMKRARYAWISVVSFAALLVAETILAVVYLSPYFAFGVIVPLYFLYCMWSYAIQLEAPCAHMPVAVHAV
ncbi:unnamed protein product (mitochondrion) [Plasmodiophora brassicae]|uniref:Uncharacterized protein n=1 Tax=Plasmodiophora brassicae TaxID=37360 RepID=A0A3P3Y5A0_PLABS|nr:unnamed protein product [Plasmodiophora brassicae]